MATGLSMPQIRSTILALYKLVCMHVCRASRLAGGQQLKPSAAKLLTIHSQSHRKLMWWHCLPYIVAVNGL